MRGEEEKAETALGTADLRRRQLLPGITEPGLQAGKLNHKLLQLGKKTGNPLVATNDVHYLEQSEAGAHDVLLCIQTQKTVEDPGRLKFGGDGFYLKSEQEMKAAFADYPPEVLDNTLQIAALCELEFDFSRCICRFTAYPSPIAAQSIQRSATKV